MTDEIWRPEDHDTGGRRPGRREAEMDEFDQSEFGGPLFGDGPAPEPPAQPRRAKRKPPPAEEAVITGQIDQQPEVAPPEGEGIRLDDDSGAMPHWTADPTGEVPTIAPAVTERDPTDDLDVWSTFTSEAPVWKEGDSVDAPSGVVPPAPVDPTGEISWEDAPAEADEGVVTASAGVTERGAPVADADRASMPTEANDAVSTAPREPARITIGTDPSGMPRRPEPARRGAAAQRPPAAGSHAPSGSRRNLPVAIATGAALAVVFIAASMWKPLGALIFVTVVLALAAFEYFAKVTEKGYRPAVAAGMAACVCAPLAAYWVGDSGLPLVMALAFIAGSLSFIGSDSIEVGPMPNMAITTLGIVWIGVLGSFAALIIRYSNFFGGVSYGTDTLVLLAIGVVANDVGAFFVGSAFGRTPLRAWISPNKSVEGFLGGTILTLISMLIVGQLDRSTTWSDTTHLLMLGIVIAIFAPLGDLTESMFKRNLDIKDFGSMIKGHGGVLDRFDGFLFALPAVYYLMLVVEPWTALSS